MGNIYGVIFFLGLHCAYNIAISLHNESGDFLCLFVCYVSLKCELKKGGGFFLLSLRSHGHLVCLSAFSVMRKTNCSLTAMEGAAVDSHAVQCVHPEKIKTPELQIIAFKIKELQMDSFTF